MTTTTSILGIVPGLMATSLVGNNLKLMKKPTSKKMIKVGVTNFIGIGMVGATAGMINKL